ncbi:MAG: class I SAM-dependent methyltransferase [Kiritimatiellae bacterium]|nr:class I SAM-dependent methyltransferase [Kiritimatiellia bacterium]
MRRNEQANKRYWNAMAEQYQTITRISTEDLHFGPLLPGGRELGLVPSPLKGRRCLEIGCGAAQNSIFLAKHGARCTGLDISAKQLRYARQLARQEGVTLTFHRAAMDAMPCRRLGTFDFIHSTCALCFAESPQKVISDAAAMLRPSGTLLLATVHPLFNGDWLEIVGESFGLFIPDYFHPPDDVRRIPDSRRTARSHAYPVGELLAWLTDAGLSIRKVLEPQPLPIPEMSEQAICERVPYDSSDWRKLYDKVSRVPAALVVLAGKAPAYA